MLPDGLGEKVDAFEDHYESQLRKLNSQNSDPKAQLVSDSSINPAILAVNQYLLSKDADVEKLKLASKRAINPQHLEKFQETVSQAFQTFKKGEPKVGPLNDYKSDNRIYHAGFDTKDGSPVFTEKYLRLFLDINKEDLSQLTRSHSFVTENLPESFPEGTFSGNGIVYVGGGKFNWLVLLSIKTLRYLGSELPVEVIIPQADEYELDLCGRVFPALGAKCILLPHILGKEVIENFKFSGYQYKALALLVSSFENVLLLDSDNVPAVKPDYLFDSEPYVSKGLICWPDFWKRATSPYFYDISGIKVLEKRVRFGYHNYGIYEAGIINDGSESIDDIPLHDREGSIPDPTTESGQLLISKKKHAKTLLLALYYNLYGPSHYYPLFSQGSDGEGDKETFLAAAIVLGKPYYQVNKFLNAFGHFDEDRNFVGCGMGQYDPVEDHEILQHNLEVLNGRLYQSYEEAQQNGVSLWKKEPRIVFVHANFPKLNPMGLKNQGKLLNKKGERIRLYGEGMRKRVGYDFELVQWNSMDYLMCELDIKVEAFKGQARDEVCQEIKQQLEFLKSSEKYLD